MTWIGWIPTVLVGLLVLIWSIFYPSSWFFLPTLAWGFLVKIANWDISLIVRVQKKLGADNIFLPNFPFKVLLDIMMLKKTIKKTQKFRYKLLRIIFYRFTKNMFFWLALDYSVSKIRGCCDTRFGCWEQGQKKPCNIVAFLPKKFLCVWKVFVRVIAKNLTAWFSNLLDVFKTVQVFLY